LYDPQRIKIDTKPGESRAMNIVLHRRAGTLIVAVRIRPMPA